MLSESDVKTQLKYAVGIHFRETSGFNETSDKTMDTFQRIESPHTKRIHGEDGTENRISILVQYYLSKISKNIRKNEHY